MTRTFTILLLLLAAGCSTSTPRRSYTDEACAAGEATYACQVQRYYDVAQ